MSSLLDLLKAKKQDLAATKRRKTIKPTDGTGRYRILPSWRGEGQQFWHDFSQHFVKDATGKLQAIYMCTDKTFGRPCAVCDAVSSAIKSTTDDVTMETLKEARSSSSVLLNVLHVDGPNPSEIQILEIRPSVFEMIVNIAQEWEEAGQSIFDLATGKDLLITRTGTGKTNTKYTVQIAASARPLPADFDISKLHDLDAYVQQESSEAQLRALNSVRATAGLLPAPAASTSGLPAAAAAAGAATMGDDDMYAAAPAPAPRPRPVVADEGVVDVAPKATPAPAAAAPAPVAAAPAAPAASASTGDGELDDLLAQLG